MIHDESPETVTAGVVDQGRSAGRSDGEATLASLIGCCSSRGGKPGAKAVLTADGTKVVAFEFDTDDVLADHAARHPVLIQVIRGRVEFTLPDGPITLEPGQVIHLTPMLRHAVKALEPTTLTVTMLLPRD